MDLQDMMSSKKYIFTHSALRDNVLNVYRWYFQSVCNDSQVTSLRWAGAAPGHVSDDAEAPAPAAWSGHR